MKTPFITIPEGTTAIKASVNELFCFKPIEGNIISPDGSEPPKSMVYIDGEWVYSYADLSEAVKI